MAGPTSLKKRQEWKNKVLKQKESGLSVERWCHENGIASHLFHYWKKQLFLKTFSRLSFTELGGDKNTGIVIECKGARIYLDKYFDPAALKSCLSILRTGKC